MTLTLPNIQQALLSFLTQSDGSLQYCTLSFLITFAVFYLFYMVARRSRRWLMMAYVVAFSIFFAYKGNGWLTLLLPATAVVSWLLTAEVRRARKRLVRKAWLTLTIVVVLAPLLYFKYTNFLLQIVNEALQTNFSPLAIFLPIGISFYTFQAISYSVDVYRGRFTERVNLLEYIFYLTFFPLLFAGPITRAETLIPQIKQKGSASPEMLYTGVWLIILGLVKKGVVADYIAQFNNWIFDDPMGYSGFENLMGVLGYTLQIYCDFSGYSDLSIGLAALLGFRLLENFNNPYQSLNLTEFWRRWHMSLSFWFRDYVYIPLGGNRKGRWRTYLNNFLTMLVAGLWHGASWMFVIWGALHGAGLVVHKFLKPWLDRVPNILPVRVVAWALTFAYVAVAWIFFRASSVENAVLVMRRIATDFSLDYLVPFCTARPTWSAFVGVGFLLCATRIGWYNRLQGWFVRSPWLVKAILLVAAVELVANFQQENVQPFIYSQF